MEEEIEDLVGDVKYTDSQKSVATTNMYSMDFDSCSDKNNSSGQGTYVIECDDSEDSETFLLHSSRSVVNLYDEENKLFKEDFDVAGNNEKSNKRKKTTATSVQKCIFVSQEIFTQTSKTIIELAEIDTVRNVERKSLETQTSVISIKESKFVEQSLEVKHSRSITNGIKYDMNINNEKCYITCDQLLNSSLDDGSSKFLTFESENDNASIGSERIINIIGDDYKENVISQEQIDNQYENTSDFEDFTSDIEEDSLTQCCRLTPIPDNESDTSDVTKSVDQDIEDLYNKLSESIDLYPFDKTSEEGRKKLGALTPLTEESTIKKDSLDTSSNIIRFQPENNEILFTNNGVRIKLLPDEEINKSTFKLPPIQNNKSCPNSPHLNLLFSLNASSKPSERLRALPTVMENQRRGSSLADRWEIGNKDLASGEGTLFRSNCDSVQHPCSEIFQLPPIHIEGHVMHNLRATPLMNDKLDTHSVETYNDSISIKNKIRELKMISRDTKKIVARSPRSRSDSPNSVCPEGRYGDVAEKGCEALCAELCRRLRSPTWTQIADTLEDIPRSLEKFWGVITEQRIADLIRLVTTHVESPRTQVARSACHTLAAILKNTNYTKKPDFYEAITTLLTKTGSYSRPVRRAANMALDNIVSGVEFCHAVTALCIHGASHKSPLVRCACARLLVVSCALRGGGRDVLRARPPSAAAARGLVLTSLAALLEDKATDTRKYAERLYSMLRPLANFEAYYLTDVDVEQASRQMKKYDQLLLCDPKTR